MNVDALKYIFRVINLILAHTSYNFEIIDDSVDFGISLDINNNVNLEI